MAYSSPSSSSPPVEQPAVPSLSEIEMFPEVSMLVPDRDMTDAVRYFPELAVSGNARSQAPEDPLPPLSPSPSISASHSAVPYTPRCDSQDEPPSPARSTDGVTGKEYPCVEGNCDKVFSRRYSLTVHMRCHTGEMPYTCLVPGCSMKCKWRSSMAHHNKNHERSGEIRVRQPIVQDKNLKNRCRRNSAAKRPEMLQAATRNELPAAEAASKIGYDTNGTGNDKSAEKPTSVAALVRKRRGGNASSAASLTGIMKTRQRARKERSADKIGSARKQRVGKYPVVLSGAAAMAVSAVSHANSGMTAPVSAAPPRSVGVQAEDAMYFSPATTALAMDTQGEYGHGLPLQDTASPASFMLLTNQLPEIFLPALSTTVASHEASSDILEHMLPAHFSAASLHDSGSIDEYDLGQTCDPHNMWSPADLDSVI